MKKYLMMLCTGCLPYCINAQETESLMSLYEQQMETLTEKQEAEPKDDAHWQQLDKFHSHRINLNADVEDDLKELHILTDLQIDLFVQYRFLLGNFLHLYELQAIPGWDIATIQKLLPYITVSDRTSLTAGLRQRLRGGRSNLLWRVAEQPEKSKGFEQTVDTGAAHYLGSRQKLFFRYTYNYNNLLQYGILGDKDAGEQFFKGKQQYGFDFYSFHLYLKNIKVIRSLAVGDFTVNMGQGLIQWQTLAFGKSAEIMGVKRQSAILRPYHSAGEYNFHRGAGITLKAGRMETTVFLSFRKLSANFAADTGGRDESVSAFENSGYHRTATENADRNNLTQTSAGVNISFMQGSWHVGINGVQYYFSGFLKKQDRPYNLFAIQGNNWRNQSIDYSYTYRNIHLFGEWAIDKNLNTAMVNGLLASLHKHIDFSLLYRNIRKNYQALYANAFTENASPTNEKGLYAGVNIRPFPGWRIDAYADLFYFPWIKYRIDAPGRGKDFFVRLSYQPSKTWSIYTRFKKETKPLNSQDPGYNTYTVTEVPGQNWRTEYAVHLNREMLVRNRVEIVWYDKKGYGYEQGFTALIDFFFHPSFKPFSGNIRMQYFETGGYNSRIYVYENDMLYNFSIPFFYDKGFRYYINLHANLKKLWKPGGPGKMTVEGWIKWAQSIYPWKKTIGSELDEVPGNKKSEMKLQVLLGW